MGARETSPGRFDVTDLIQKTYDTGIIRRLLDEAFDEDDLNAFLYDYFRPFRAGFDQFPTKKAKIQFLIEKPRRNPRDRPLARLDGARLPFRLSPLRRPVTTSTVLSAVPQKLLHRRCTMS